MLAADRPLASPLKPTSAPPLQVQPGQGPVARKVLIAAWHVLSPSSRFNERLQRPDPSGMLLIRLAAYGPQRSDKPGSCPPTACANRERAQPPTAVPRMDN